MGNQKLFENKAQEVRCNTENFRKLQDSQDAELAKEIVKRAIAFSKNSVKSEMDIGTIQLSFAVREYLKLEGFTIGTKATGMNETSYYLEW